LTPPVLLEVQFKFHGKKDTNKVGYRHAFMFHEIDFGPSELVIITLEPRRVHARKGYKTSKYMEALKKIALHTVTVSLIQCMQMTSRV
jgi:hypothetical protein